MGDRQGHCEGANDLPRHDLVSHSAIRITLFPRKTEIGKLQFALAGEQQIIRFQILKEDGRTNPSACESSIQTTTPTHSM